MAPSVFQKHPYTASFVALLVLAALGAALYYGMQIKKHSEHSSATQHTSWPTTQGPTQTPGPTPAPGMSDADFAALLVDLQPVVAFFDHFKKNADQNLAADAPTFKLGVAANKAYAAAAERLQRLSQTQKALLDALFRPNPFGGSPVRTIQFITGDPKQLNGNTVRDPNYQIPQGFPGTLDPAKLAKYGAVHVGPGLPGYVPATTGCNADPHCAAVLFDGNALAFSTISADTWQSDGDVWRDLADQKLQEERPDRSRFYLKMNHDVASTIAPVAQSGQVSLH